MAPRRRQDTVSDETTQRTFDRVQFLETQIRLAKDLDELLENAVRAQASMAQTVPRALKLLRAVLRADAALVRTRDETGEWIDYADPDAATLGRIDVAEIAGIVDDLESYLGEYDGDTVYGYRLDLSDAHLGTVVVRRAGRDPEEATEWNLTLLRVWSEQLDNFLAAVAESRRKQRAITEISDALKDPILERGLTEALAILRVYVPVDDLVVVCRSEEVLEKSTSCYRILTDGELRYDSTAAPEPRIEALLRGAIKSLLTAHREEQTLRELGIDATHLEEVPIRGFDGATVVGRVIVGTDREPLSPFARDLVDRFADYLRQRVVDFSKEWKRLSRNFPRPTVERLLREEDYVERFLRPREAQAAILFTDISGFTRLSEETLRSPAAIARLIDRWSHHCVEIIWETGGVFDKMIGDCIIALWGPPYFDVSPAESCRRAIDAARRIRDYTRALQHSADFPELARASAPIGVSSGLNFGPLYVGLFGPSEDYTGFSSTMNATQRLQDLANRDEILCMEPVAEALGQPSEFGESAMATVKNVAQPLKFRRLR